MSLDADPIPPVVRFFVASDLHGNRRAIDELPLQAERIPDGAADATILCGDLSHLGKPPGFLAELCPRLPQPVFAIPGNVDPPAILEEIEAAGARGLHDRRIRFGGLDLVGFGGTKPTPFHGRFTTEDDEIERRLAALWPNGSEARPVVLVVHGPPIGTLDRAFRFLSIGSPAVARVVARERPALVLSGHVHEARGTHVAQGVSYLNPGAGKRGHAGWASVETRPRGRVSIGLL